MRDPAPVALAADPRTAGIVVWFPVLPVVRPGWLPAASGAVDASDALDCGEHGAEVGEGWRGLPVRSCVVEDGCKAADAAGRESVLLVEERPDAVGACGCRLVGHEVFDPVGEVFEVADGGACGVDGVDPVGEGGVLVEGGPSISGVVGAAGRCHPLTEPKRCIEAEVRHLV